MLAVFIPHNPSVTILLLCKLLDTMVYIEHNLYIEESYFVIVFYDIITHNNKYDSSSDNSKPRKVLI